MSDKNLAVRSLSELLAEVMGKVAYVQKDAKNDHHGYRYASAEAVLGKVNAECSSRGIAVSSKTELLQYGPRTVNGKESSYAVVHMTLTFIRGGETIAMQGLGEGSDKGDKAIMKANTAALKYAVASGFLISWGDDPEADSGTDREAVVKPPSSPAKAPKAAKATTPAPAVNADTSGLLDAVKAATPEQREALRGQVRGIKSSDPDTYKACVAAAKELWT